VERYPSARGDDIGDGVKIIADGVLHTVLSYVGDANDVCVNVVRLIDDSPLSRCPSVLAWFITWLPDHVIFVGSSCAEQGVDSDEHRQNATYASEPGRSGIQPSVDEVHTRRLACRGQVLSPCVAHLGHNRYLYATACIVFSSLYLTCPMVWLPEII
jgi:hypothetical protein